jgi:hypothetical protein
VNALVHDLLTALNKSVDQLAPPAPPGPTTITAAQLQRTNLPPLSWAIPGVLPAGLTLLAGKPKSGKSWLAYAVAIAVAAGGRALGSVPVEAGDVLYLSLEDGSRRLQDRLNIILDGADAPERLHLAHDWPRDAIPAIEQWLSAHPHARLVVVDTLARIRVDHAGDSAYMADYAALGPLQRLATAWGIALLVVHHVRKASAGDVFDTVSGTLGLTGAADTIAVLVRDLLTPTASLHLRGRDVESTDLSLLWHPHNGLWTLAKAGDMHTVRLVALLQRLGGSATKRDLQRDHHWRALDLDAAINASRGALLTDTATNPHGRSTVTVRLASDNSDNMPSPSGRAGDIVAFGGHTVAMDGSDQVREPGH